MKKALTVFLAILITISSLLSVSAADASGNAYIFDGITIKFSADSSFTAEEQAAIAQKVVDGIDDSSSTTYNVLCTLFGHKTTTESFTVIEHCVRADQPKCLESLQNVTACSRCDYVNTEVIGSVYIICCE